MRRSKLYNLTKPKDVVIAMEESSTGKTVEEREYTYYAKIADQNVFKQATSYEDQDQVSVHILGEGKPAAGLRIRKTTFINNVVEYVQTLKIKTKSSDTVAINNETSLPSSEDAFNQFSLINTSRMVKRRYFIPYQNELQFEVDVFFKEDGSMEEWCKIDAELPESVNINPLEFIPKEFTEIINGASTEGRDKDFISTLYKDIFSK